MNAMSRRRLAPLTLLTLLAVTAAMLRPTPIAAAPGDGHAGAELPEFARIPATHTNLVVLDDLMPTVRSIVVSPRLLQPLNRFVTALGEDGVADADLEGLVDWLKQTDDQRQAALLEAEAAIPKRILFATDDATIALLGQAAEAAAVGVVAVAANELDAADANLADPYLDRLVELAEGFVTPRAVLALTMRDAATAMQMLGGLQMGAGFIGAEPGINVQMMGNGLAIDINLNEVFNGDVNSVAESLSDMGLGAPENPKVQQLAAAVLKITFRFAFETQDDQFLVTIGPAPAEGDPALSSEVLGELWPRYARPGTGVLFARFAPEPLLESVKGIEAAFDIGPDTPIGQAMAENPQPMGVSVLGFLSVTQVQGIREAIEQMGTQQDFAVWLDGGLQIEGIAQNVPEAESLEGVNLPDRLPGELPLVFVSNAQPIGNTIATQSGSIIAQVEQMMQMEALEQANGDEERADAIAKLMLDKLAPLKTLLTEEAPVTFGTVAGGIAGVVETAERVTLTAGRLDAPKTVTLETLPVPAGLLFFEVAEGKDGLGYLARLYNESVNAAEAFGEFDAPAAAKSLAEADLGLGVKTLRVDLSWIQQLAAAEGELAQLQLLGASADFHAFDFDGMLVLSTSPALSKRFIAAWVANGQPLEGQDALAEMIVPEVDGQLIGFARMEPSGLVFSLRQATDSIENIKASDPNMIDDDFGADQAATTMRLVADLMEELALSEFVIFDKGQTRTTRGAINLSRQLN
ncbi:MAG: hypothetical protein AAF797_15835 [Planctomycetota bacterium]